MNHTILSLLFVILLQIDFTKASSCTHLVWPQKPFCENYPLHWAATTGNIDDVLNLLEDDTDIDQKTGGVYRGNTALHISGRYGRADVVRLLLRNGADETIRNDAGETPLHRAHIQFCSQDPRNTWCTLAASDYTATLTLLQDGCAASGCTTGRHCVARRCLRVMTQINTGNPHVTCGPHIWFWWSAHRCRNYPFHWAAVTGDEAEVASFLQQGSEVDLRDGDQYTPLMLAAWAGRAGTVSLLLDHGADTSLTNVRGRTALLLANKRFCSDPNSKGCRLGDVDYHETIRFLQHGRSSSRTTTTTAMTQTGTPCVRFQYWGTWYEASSCICCWNSKSWCATSTSPRGYIGDWDYCSSRE